MINSYQNQGNNVQVIIRVRPLTNAYHVENGGDQLVIASQAQSRNLDIKRCIKEIIDNKTIILDSKEQQKFDFDYVAGENVSQDQIFKILGKSIVDSCIQGYNSTIFAYGQTGSGKTHTIQGQNQAPNGNAQNHGIADPNNDQRGILPRQFEYLFDEIKRIKAKHKHVKDIQRNGKISAQHNKICASPAGIKESQAMNYKQFGDDIEEINFEILCSFSEIYKEQIFDLLDPSQKKLNIREDLTKGIILENETQVAVKSLDEVLAVINKGQMNRSVASTNMNRESSRSHAIFTAYIKITTIDINNNKTQRSSKLNVVDLAGSERVKDTQADGQRLKEACQINMSLSFLGKVIYFLAEKESKKSSSFINFRESKLTHLLKDSLGGNSKTLIICTLNPNQMAYRETLSTLNFAQRAKKIKNKAVVNEENTETFYKKKCSELQKEIDLLRLQQGNEIMRHVPNFIESDRKMSNEKERNQIQIEKIIEITQNIFSQQNELQSFQYQLKDWITENDKLKLTLKIQDEDFKKYQSQCAFRIKLYESKEQKQINEFFQKYLNSDIQINKDLSINLQSLKDIITRMTEEKAILKKQIDFNPIAAQLNAQLQQLKSELNQYKESSSNNSDSMMSKISILETMQNEIMGKLVFIYELLQELQQVESYQEDQIMKDENDEIQIESIEKSKSVSRSRYNDIKESKIKYDQLLQQKNLRIQQLEDKNKVLLELMFYNENQQSLEEGNFKENILCSDSNDQLELLEFRNHNSQQFQAKQSQKLEQILSQFQVIVHDKNDESNNLDMETEVKTQQVNQIIEELQQILQQTNDKISEKDLKILLLSKEIEDLKSQSDELNKQNNSLIQKIFEESDSHKQSTLIFQSDIKLLEKNASELKIQLDELKLENEQLLTKLASQDSLLQDKDELQQQLDLVLQENDENKQTLNYFNNDMMPSMRAGFEKAQQLNSKYKNEIEKLKVENTALKGNNEHQLVHYQQQNQILQETVRETDLQLKNALADKDEYKQKIDGVTGQLNCKIQQFILKEQECQDLDCKYQQLLQEFNDKIIEINSINEQLESVQQDLVHEQARNKKIYSDFNIANDTLQTLNIKYQQNQNELQENLNQIESYQRLFEKQEMEFGKILEDNLNLEKQLQDLEKVRQLDQQEYNNIKTEFQKSIDQLKAKLQELNEQNSQLMKDKASIEANLIDKVRQEIQKDIDPLIRQNQELKDILQKKDIQLRCNESELLKMNEILQNNNVDQSKLMISNNQQAKADHFMKVKTQLNKAQQDNSSLKIKNELYESKEKQYKKKASETIQDIVKLRLEFTNVLQKYNIEETITVLERTARERDGNIINFETAFDRICDFVSSHFKLILKLNTQIKNNFV